MMRKLIALMTLLLVQATMAYGVEEVVVVTEEFAPYNYTDTQSGKITGVSTEILEATSAKAGIAITINMMPWARAYQMAQTDENVLIYSITRTPQRENMFKWVGSIAPINFCLFALQQNDQAQAADLDAAKQFTIGAVRDTAEMQYLQNEGFTIEKWDIANSHEDNINKLRHNRIDMLIWDELAFSHKIKELGHNPADYKKVLFLEEASSELYMAFSLQTDDQLVQQFADALAQIKADGTFDAIVKKYIN